MDVLQRRSPFYEGLAAVLAAAETGQVEGYVAAHSITTLYYLLAKGRSAAVARGTISDLLQILDEAPMDRTAIDRALVMAVADFENAVQVAAAEGVGADHVIARDLNDFRHGSVKAILPAELLTLL